jgi:hypothetical protein
VLTSQIGKAPEPNFLIFQRLSVKSAARDREDLIVHAPGCAVRPFSMGANAAKLCILLP